MTLALLRKLPTAASQIGASAAQKKYTDGVSFSAALPVSAKIPPAMCLCA